MLEILGEKYYIDVDKIIEACRPDNPPKPVADGEEQQVELNIFKFDCYKVCLDRVLAEYEGEADEGVAVFTNQVNNPGFAIAFNTLERKEILKKDD